MAILTVKEDRYGVVEFNNFSAQREGRNKAQLPLNSTDFVGINTPCEQGMLLVYDEATGSVRKPTSINDNVMLHKSEEKLYDDRLQALKNFALFGDNNASTTVETTDATGAVIGSVTVDFASGVNPYPRLYQLDIGDTFTTNTIVFDSSVFADFDALKAAFIAKTPIWGVPQVGLTGNDSIYNGYISLSTTAPAAGVKKPLRVINVYTMPDGSNGIKLEVYPAMA